MSHDRHDALLYLYGIADAGAGSDALPGVAAVVHRSLAALVEPVPAADFSADALALRLQSLEWVAGLARRHEALLTAAMRSGPVIPARLCTLFSGLDAVRSLLAEREDELVALLARLTGAEEWGLKVLCDVPTLRDVVAANDRENLALAQAAAAATTPGQAYILRLRRDAHAAQLADLRLEAVQDLVIDTLESFGLATRVKPLRADDDADRRRMILNLAVLAPVAGRDRLDAELDHLARDLAREGFSVVRSGPWPPFSFTVDDADDPDAEVCA